jgi:hypothetical protein
MNFAISVFIPDQELTATFQELTAKERKGN